MGLDRYTVKGNFISRERRTPDRDVRRLSDAGVMKIPPVADASWLAIVVMRADWQDR